LNIFVATNNSSLGAIQNAVSSLKNRYPGCELFLLVEENRSAAYARFFMDCKITSYRQGSLFSAGGMFRFYLELRAANYEYYVVLKEKEKSYDLKYDLLYFLSGAKSKLVYNAVDGNVYKKTKFDKVFKIFFSRILLAVLLCLFLPFILLVYLLAFPGWLFRGKIITALKFLRKNIPGLFGYLFRNLAAFKENILLDLLLQLEFLRGGYSRVKKPGEEKIESILVLKLEHLGDMVLFLPFLRELRRNFPAARITLLACPWNVKAAENCSYVDEIIIYTTNDPAFNRGRKKFTFYIRRIFLLVKIALKGYDLCLDSGGWVETFKIACFSRAKVKIAMNYSRYPRLFNFTLVEPEAKQADLLRNFSLLRPLGIKGGFDTGPEYPVSKKETKKAKEFLEENGFKDGRLLGFYAGSSSPAKSWPKENFIRLMDLLSDNEIILFNAPGEDKLVKEIAGKLKKRPLLTPENLTLNEFAALVGFCKVFVAEGGGLFHIASSRGVPVVGLFGAGDVLRWGNYTKKNIGLSKMFPCSPCRQTHCIRNLCMEAIKVEEVLEAVKCVLE